MGERTTQIERKQQFGKEETHKITQWKDRARTHTLSAPGTGLLPSSAQRAGGHGSRHANSTCRDLTRSQRRLRFNFFR